MELVKIINGKKFMWDGATYLEEKGALEKAQEYKNTGFEIGMISEEGRFFVFTRRLVKEIVIEGQPI